MQRSLDPLHQVHHPTAQSVGNDFEGLDGDVAFATLDFPNVSTMQAGFVSKQILGPASF